MVILIDDNPIDNFLAKRVIENSGFEGTILTTESGQQALDYLKLNINRLDLWPNLIFLDINMPVVDGYAFLYEFRHFPINVRGKTKVVILSSSDDIQDLSKLVDRELVISYLVKPLTAAKINDLKNTFNSFNNLYAV